MRRIHDMDQDVGTQIVSRLQYCKYFSLTLNKICYITDNAQLRIFLRYTKDNFDIVEKLLHLSQLVFTTGEGIFKELKNITEVNKVEWSKLNSVCPDRAICMVGRGKGIVR